MVDINDEQDCFYKAGCPKFGHFLRKLRNEICQLHPVAHTVNKMFVVLILSSFGFILSFFGLLIVVDDVDATLLSFID